MRTREEIKKERDEYKKDTDMFTIIYLKLLELELNQVELKDEIDDVCSVF